MTLVYIWLGILTLALAAHMFKDASEFRRIDRLEGEIDTVKRIGQGVGR